MNRSMTSLPSWVRVESLVADEESVESVECGACDLRVLSADWALEMSSLESAEETLERNWSSGSDEPVSEEVYFSTSDR